MIDISALPMLKGKKALVTGIANDQSIAWGCAKAFRTFGADLAMTYRNEKAKKFVEPLAKEVDASIFMPLDLQTEGSLEAIFEQIERQWGKLDIGSIPLPSRLRPISRAASSIARRKAFSSPWTCPAGRSSAWRSSPSP